LTHGTRRLAHISNEGSGLLRSVLVPGRVAEVYLFRRGVTCAERISEGLKKASASFLKKRSKKLLVFNPGFWNCPGQTPATSFLPQSAQTPAKSKSFLLLFFKKEALAFPCFAPCLASPYRPLCPKPPPDSISPYFISTFLILTRYTRVVRKIIHEYFL
jgi:hypothetical protein